MAYVILRFQSVGAENRFKHNINLTYKGGGGANACSDNNVTITRKKSKNKLEKK